VAGLRPAPLVSEDGVPVEVREYGSPFSMSASEYRRASDPKQNPYLRAAEQAHEKLKQDIAQRVQPGDLTGVQRATYEFIWHYTRKNGFPPSMRDIGKATGCNSTSTVAYRLASLEARGWIGRGGHGSPRGINLLVDLE
jgi:hypothetical protein